MIVAGTTAIVPGCRELSWAFSGSAVSPTGLDGIPTYQAAAPTAPTANPNGVIGMDHVVVLSGRPAHTRAVFEQFGLEARGAKIRADKGPDRSECFFWAGDVLIELVGPVDDLSEQDQPARIWGVTFVVEDFEALQSASDVAIGAPRPAVQEGRMISTLSKEAGLGLAVAFMSPHPKREK